MDLIMDTWRELCQPICRCDCGDTMYKEDNIWLCFTCGRQKSVTPKEMLE